MQGWDNHLVLGPLDNATQNMWLFQVDPDNLLNQLVALNTDMILAYPIDYSGPNHVGLTYEQQSPNDGQTCEPFLDDTSFSEVLSGPNFTPLCRANRQGQILYSNDSTPSFAQILRYINVTSGNSEFLRDFAESYAKMTSVGYGPGGKLGSLTPLNLSTCPAIMAGILSNSAKSNSSTQPSPLVALVVLIVIPIGALLAYYFFFLTKTNKPINKRNPVPAVEPEDSAVAAAAV